MLLQNVMHDKTQVCLWKEKIKIHLQEVYIFSILICQVKIHDKWNGDLTQRSPNWVSEFFYKTILS